jgi:hypothetical protein
LREKEVDMWRAAVGDPYPMEKNPDEIPMFTQFAERGLSSGQRLLQGAAGVLRHRVPQPQPQRYLPRLSLRTLLRSLLGDQAPLDLIPEILPGEAPAQRQQSPSSGGSRDPDEGGRRGAVPLLQAD